MDDSGLLFPPDLWGLLDYSIEADLIVAAFIETQRTPTGHDDPADLLQQLAEIYGEDLDLQPSDARIQATWILHWTGVISPENDPRLYSGVQELVVESAAAAPPETLWMATDLAQVADESVELSNKQRQKLENALQSDTVAEAQFASDVLGRAVTSKGHEFRTPRDAAWVIWMDVQKGQRFDDIDTHTLEVASGGIEEDDVVLGLLVDAAHKGDGPERAGSFAQRFDRRRLTPSGVLEPPVFEGTVGSTFRVVDYLEKARPRLIDAQQRAKIASAVIARKDDDILHETAAEATLKRLGESTLDDDAAGVLIDKAVEEILGSGDPVIEAELVPAWLFLRSYAQALEVSFPRVRFSPKLASIYRSAGLDESAEMTARILSIADRHDDLDREALASLLSDLAERREPHELTTTTLLAADIGFRRVKGRALFDSADITEIVKQRTGRCLGNYEGLVRQFDESHRRATSPPANWLIAGRKKRKMTMRSSRFVKLSWLLFAAAMAGGCSSAGPDPEASAMCSGETVKVTFTNVHNEAQRYTASLVLIDSVDADEWDQLVSSELVEPGETVSVVDEGEIDEIKYCRLEKVEVFK